MQQTKQTRPLPFGSGRTKSANEEDRNKGIEGVRGKLKPAGQKWGGDDLPTGTTEEMMVLVTGEGKKCKELGPALPLQGP